MKIERLSKSHVVQDYVRWITVDARNQHVDLSSRSELVARAIVIEVDRRKHVASVQGVVDSLQDRWLIEALVLHVLTGLLDDLLPGCHEGHDALETKTVIMWLCKLLMLDIGGHL